MEESIHADRASVVFPVDAVGNHANTVLQDESVPAFLAFASFHGLAAFHGAFVASELEAGETVGAVSSLISETSCGGVLAGSVSCDEESAVASCASEIVVGFAVGDFTVAVFQFERLET